MGTFLWAHFLKTYGYIFMGTFQISVALEIVQMSRCADEQMSRCADEQKSRCADEQMSRCADEQMCR